MCFLFVILTVPESCEELKSLLSGKSMEDQLLVVERIQKCNHPSLAVGNKAKLGVRWLSPCGTRSGQRPGSHGTAGHRALAVFAAGYFPWGRASKRGLDGCRLRVRGRPGGVRGAPALPTMSLPRTRVPGSGCWACAGPLPVNTLPDHSGAGHVLHPGVWCCLPAEGATPGPCTPRPAACLPSCTHPCSPRHRRPFEGVGAGVLGGALWARPGR